jgi:hypothetical protein
MLTLPPVAVSLSLKASTSSRFNRPASPSIYAITNRVSRNTRQDMKTYDNVNFANEPSSG